ncbi:restriction endonuclease [Bdellovibrio bacteriovorus]|uniref:restriction endonuclease n=1 Tax=Bdellovibrio bacteriovorus TaxID=959 RepID=UPI0035A66C8B
MALPKGFPTFDELMAPTVLAIRQLGGSGNNGEVVEKIIEICKFPEEYLNHQQLGQSGSVLEYRAAWARTYLKAGGVLDNSRKGVWTLTEYGKTFDIRECSKVLFEARQKFAEKNSQKPKSIKFEDAQESQAETQWKNDLLNVLTKKMPPDGFERLSQRLLREAGFKEVRVTGRANDGGIDGVGVLRSGLLSEIVLFQCKRYQGSVGPSVVRDFRGAMQGRSTKGIIITTGSFTMAAKEEATRDGAHPIELIDGDQLCELLREYKIGVNIQLVEAVTIDDEFFKAV